MQDSKYLTEEMKTRISAENGVYYMEYYLNDIVYMKILIGNISELNKSIDEDRYQLQRNIGEHYEQIQELRKSHNKYIDLVKNVDLLKSQLRGDFISSDYLYRVLSKIVDPNFDQDTLSGMEYICKKEVR